MILSTYSFDSPRLRFLSLDSGQKGVAMVSSAEKGSDTLPWNCTHKYLLSSLPSLLHETESILSKESSDGQYD